MMGHDETMIGAETGMTVSMTAVAYLDCFTVYFIFFSLSQVTFLPSLVCLLVTLPERLTPHLLWVSFALPSTSQGPASIRFAGEVHFSGSRFRARGSGA